MSKKQLIAALDRNKRAADKLREAGNKLHAREKEIIDKLVALIAKERGLVAGRRYKVFPKTGGRGRQVIVRSFGHTYGTEFKDISVYCHVVQKDGETEDLRASRWFYTAQHDFVPVK